jgi:hypothetical protein
MSALTGCDGDCDNASMSGDLVRVLSAPSVIEGEIAKSRLEAENIPVLLKGGGGDPYRVGPVYLFVPAEFEIQARLALEPGPLDGDGATAEKPEGR